MSQLVLVQPDVLLGEDVLAFSTTRDIKNGASKPQTDSDFASFNMGLHVGDVKNAVFENRQILKRFINQQTVHDCDLIWLDQIHSNKVLVIDSTEQAKYMLRAHKAQKADAIITNQVNLALCIVTADCVPILLFDSLNKQIAAIHAGWRGLENKIIQNTIDLLATSAHQIQAWIGPCISQTHFELGAELADTFEAYPNAIMPSSTGKFKLDLNQITLEQLNAAGVENIQQNSQCTYAQDDLFYSHRRSTHLQQKSCGRMSNIIMLTQ